MFATKPLSETQARRLMDGYYFDTSGDCWEWLRSKTPDGYGTWDGTTAHRRLWLALVGPIPDGFHLDHLCRNRSCVNPDHCEPVTHAENVRRGHAGGVRSGRFTGTHCRNGHEYTEENTYWFRDGIRRYCITCHNARQRQRRLTAAP